MLAFPYSPGALAVTWKKMQKADFFRNQCMTSLDLKNIKIPKNPPCAKGSGDTNPRWPPFMGWFGNMHTFYQTYMCDTCFIPFSGMINP